MIKRDKIYQTIFAYVFILPAFILLGIFLFYPTIYSLILSLLNYNIISPPTFVGLKNFQKVFSDRDFWEALGRSITYLLVVPPIQFVSILMAILVNRELRGISFFRLSYYIPVVTSTVAVAVVWKWIYDGDYGLLNAILSLLGLIGEGRIFPSRPLWLSDPSLVLPSVMFVTFWKGLGFYMMIYLASLKNIPVERVPKKVREKFKEKIKNGYLPAGVLIDALGFKGYQIGGAKISEKHANFIVNVGKAKAKDVLKLINLIKKKVKENFKVDLELEIELVGF